MRHERAFRDLEFQQCGIYAMAAHGFDDLGNEAVLAHLPRRYVHGDSDLAQTRQLPFADLPARHVDDPGADRHDQAQLLERGNEKTRLDETVSWAVPADQRFDAGPGSAVDLHLRLVMQDEFIPSLRKPQGARDIRFF